MSASRNHLSSKTNVEQKINAPDNSSGTNFPNLLMSGNNMYNLDAHPWPKNMILIAGDSMINGINNTRMSTNFKSVRVRWFSGSAIDDMNFNLIPLL